LSEKVAIANATIATSNRNSRISNHNHALEADLQLLEEVEDLESIQRLQLSMQECGDRLAVARATYFSRT
jgi:hypothetical protein